MSTSTTIPGATRAAQMVLRLFIYDWPAEEWLAKQIQTEFTKGTDAELKDAIRALKVQLGERQRERAAKKYFKTHPAV